MSKSQTGAPKFKIATDSGQIEAGQRRGREPAWEVGQGRKYIILKAVSAIMTVLGIAF